MNKQDTAALNTSKFTDLPLQQDLLQTLARIGFDAMTPVQAETLPAILQGRDMIAQAQTGSGKTAAFSLGILQQLQVSRFRIQSLVLCPTRELADQVATEIRRLGSSRHNIKVLTLCGGSPIGPQIGSLEHGAHIIVGTPGRILDHLEKGRLDFTELTTLVLDEADRMLDMGFSDALTAITSALPVQRQTLLFSATYTPEIGKVADACTREAVTVSIEARGSQPQIQEYFYRVQNDDERGRVLAALLKQHQPESAMVFCTTRQETQQLSDMLQEQGFAALPLHGDLEQKQRDRSLILFGNDSINILVATDVAARGLDIDTVELVVNYRVSRDPDMHIHRIGRTGRAGRKGIACTLFSEQESHRLARLDIPSDPVLNPDSPPIASKQEARAPGMKTIEIAGGKKDKLRAGDIVGALTRSGSMTGDAVGKIVINDRQAYVAVAADSLKTALELLSQGIKGRNFRARPLTRI